MQNFIIVLFKNKKKKRIIKGYQRKEYAIEKYNSLIDNQDILFEVQYENDVRCNYEIALVNTTSNIQENLFKSDSYGRNNQVFIKDNNYTIELINDFKIEEFIYDIKESKKITFMDLVKNYLSDENLKVMSVLNNKIVIQNESLFHLFTLKNEDESLRLLETSESYFISKNRTDCLFVKDSSSSHKKWLYEKLSLIGFDKKMLYRKKTNFSV